MTFCIQNDGFCITNDDLNGSIKVATGDLGDIGRLARTNNPVTNLSL